MRRVLDLNSDLGESFGRWVLGDDEAMLGLVTSANVACGFHAGDATTLRRTCALAAEHGVVVGAQVGYRDLAGFGRRFIDMEPRQLADDVLYQIGALEGLSRVAGTRVRYVKPHGALYNATVHHEAQARAVVEAVRLDVPHPRARHSAEALEGTDLVEHVVGELTGVHVDEPAPEAREVAVPHLRPDDDVVLGGQRAGAPQRRRVARVEAAGDVG